MATCAFAFCCCMLCLLLNSPKYYVQEPLRKKNTLCVLVSISLGWCPKPPIAAFCCPWNKHHDRFGKGRDFCCRLILVLSSLSRQVKQRKWHSPPPLPSHNPVSCLLLSGRGAGKEQRPNSWTKSRQKSREVSFILFTVTSTTLPWDFYSFKPHATSYSFRKGEKRKTW